MVHRHILPTLRAKLDRVRFVIVGANPARRVRGLAGHLGVTVTGRVSNVRPYLAHADVVVAPMRVAKGIQNKVLEGMAMGSIVGFSSAVPIQRGTGRDEAACRRVCDRSARQPRAPPCVYCPRIDKSVQNRRRNARQGG